MKPQNENATKAYQLAASLWGLDPQLLEQQYPGRDGIAARRAAWLAYRFAFNRSQVATERDFNLGKNHMHHAAKFEENMTDDDFETRRFAIQTALTQGASAALYVATVADAAAVINRFGRALMRVSDGYEHGQLETLLTNLAEHLEQQNELRDNRDPDGGICGGAGRVGCSSATIAGRAGSNEAPVDASNHERRCSDRGSPSEAESGSRGLQEPIQTPQNADHERDQDRLCEAEGNADNQRPGADGEADQKALSGSSRHTDQDRREASENAIGGSGCQPSEEGRRDDDGRDGRHCHQADGRGDRQAGRCVDEGQQCGSGEQSGLTDKSKQWDKALIRKTLSDRGQTLKSFAERKGLKTWTVGDALRTHRYAHGSAMAKAAIALREVAPEAAPDFIFEEIRKGKHAVPDATAMVEARANRMREAAAISASQIATGASDLTGSFAGDPAPGRSALGRELRPGE